MRRIISGGQTGVDHAALEAAYIVGIETGGFAPRNYLRHDGLQEELLSGKYNLIAINGNYRDRTYQNVRHSDGTLRIAEDWDSPGEICTWNAIKSCKKPSLDIALKVTDTVSKSTLYRMGARQRIFKFLKDYNIQVLNIAGNSEKTCPGIYIITFEFLLPLFSQIKKMEDL